MDNKARFKWQVIKNGNANNIIKYTRTFFDAVHWLRDTLNVSRADFDNDYFYTDYVDYYEIKLNGINCQDLEDVENGLE